MEQPGNRGAFPQSMRLGAHVLDLRCRELRTAADELAPLRRQSLQVLLVLAENPGHVVGKALLMERVWPDVVVGDDSLVQAVTQVRRVLGDAGQRWVRTVQRQGYMLVPDARVPLRDDAVRAERESPPLSLAILPAEGSNASAAARDWADCAVRELTLHVGRDLTGGRIIANAAVRAYRDCAVDPRDVGRALGVRQVLCSTVREGDGESRLEFVMVGASDGRQNWTRVLHAGRMGTDGVAAIARAVLVEMHAAAGASAAETPTPSAEDLAMLGWSTFYRGISKRNIEEALGCFEAAVAQDAQSLRGWCGVCVMNSDLLQLTWADDPVACLHRAAEAVDRLEQLYPGDALTLLARTKLAQLRGDWSAALLLADGLVQRNPESPTGYFKRSQALLSLGRFEECIADTQRAAQLTVDDFRAGLWLGFAAAAHLMSGRPELATDTARRGQAANACLPLPPLMLAAALAQTERQQEARAVLEQQLEHLPMLDADRVRQLLPGSSLHLVHARAQLITTLCGLGLKQ